MNKINLDTTDLDDDEDGVEIESPRQTIQDEVDEQDVVIVEEEVDSGDVDVEVDISDDAEEAEAEVEAEVDRRSDNEVIDDYLKPHTRCILCTTPIWSLKLNKAYLDGWSYSKMIDEFSIKFEERTGRALNKSLLHRHFKSHFDARAAAIAEYNKRRSTSTSELSPSTGQRDIFRLATNKYLDELEIFDATAKELITKYQELEVLIEEIRSAGKKFGIDELITKQAQILNSLNKQAISKFKALSRVDLENKQGQFLTQLSFIGNKAVTGLSQFGKQQQLLSPQEMERIYLNVVIRQMLARLEDPLKVTFGIVEKDQKTLFYRELKKAVEGIQDGISADFDKQIKVETQKLIEQKSGHSDSPTIIS